MQKVHNSVSEYSFPTDKKVFLKHNAGFPARYIPDGGRIEVSKVNSGRNTTLKYECFDKDGEIDGLIKKIFDGRTDDESLLRVYERNPELAFSREVKIYGLTGNSPNKHFIPEFTASPGENAFYLSLIKTRSERHNLVRAHNSQNEGEKNKLLFDAAKSYGIFSGLLQRMDKEFVELVRVDPTFKGGKESYTPERRFDRLNDYLKPILCYANPTLDPELPTFKIIKEVRSQHTIIDVTEVLLKIAQTSSRLINNLRLGHGDARPQHLFRGSSGKVEDFKIIDIERLGMHPRYHDLSTLISMEAGISRPSDENFAMFVATYMAHREAIVNTKDKGRLNTGRMPRGVRRLEVLPEDQMIKKVGEANVARAMLEVLVMDIEENLHIDSSNKRYTPERRQSLVSGIVGYSEEDMLKGRLERVVADFNYFTENQKWFRAHAGEDTNLAFEGLLSNYALLIQELGIAEVPTKLLDRYNRNSKTA